VRRTWRLVVAAVMIGLLAGCSPEIPSQRQPSDEQPYDGEVPAQRPRDIPESWPGVRIYFYGHDRGDFERWIPFSFNMLAVAANPALFGAFEEPDTGVTHPFRDPVTRTNLLVTPAPKKTPYGFTVWFPPNESISFTIAYGFEGEYGDVVGCEFQTWTGTPIVNTRTHAAVLNPELRNLTGGMAHASNLCTYTTGRGGPV